MSEKTSFLLLTIVLFVFVSVLFFVARRKSVTKKGVTTYYQLICVSILIWLFFTAFFFIEMDAAPAYRIAMWRYVGIAFMPVVTALHIWRQFSSQPMRKRNLILCAIPPVFSSVLIATNESTRIFIRSYELLDPTYVYRVVLHYNWGFYLHCFFSYLAGLVGIYLLLRNFFRVPKHMRKTINLMVCATSVTVACNISVLLVGLKLPYDITIIGSVVTLYLFYLALKVTRSANIIITSREYVWKNVSSMILILDEDNLILDYNKSVDMGRLDLPLPILMEPYQTFRERWIIYGKGLVSKHDDNIVTFTKDAEESHYRIRTHAIHEGSQTIGSLVEISEITEIYTLLRYMEASSRYDYLTGLYNRNAFIEIVPELCRSESLPLLVIIGDVNELKLVNDEKGHVVGDKLIQILAEILSDCAPPNTFIARIGGDEFILLRPNAAEGLGEEFMEKVYGRCARTHDVMFGTPSISLGIAVLRDEGQTLHSVIEEADKNMYATKRRQKEGVRRRYNLSSG